MNGERARKLHRRQRTEVAGAGESTMVIHRKLRVGSVDDPAEREADRLADEVTRHLSGTGRAVPTETEQAIGDRPIDQAVSRVRRSATGGPASAGGGPVSSGLEARINRARRAGTPLPASTQAEMGGAFGADFAGVRVNTGSEADSLCRSVGARAFTVDRDVFFAGNEYSPGTTGGQHLLAHELAHTLQSTDSVGRVVRREEGDTGAGTAEEETAETEGEEELAEGVVLTGSIPESEFGTTEAWSTSPPSGMQADARVPRPSAGSRRATPAPAPTGDQLYNFDVGSVDVTATDEQVSRMPSEADKDNSVKVNTTATASTASGYAATPFGGCNHGVEFGVPTYAVATKKKDKVITISLAVKNPNQWGTDSGGKIDIPSADSPLVTADTYATIVSDLTPKKVEKSWVAPRTTYWAQAICERHEKYHARDSSKWTQSQGKKFVTDYLKKKKLAISDTDLAGDGAAADTKIKDAVKDAKTAFVQALILYLRGTSGSYYSYPCEEKAFGDGKAPYEKLAGAVKKRGKVLEKQKRDAEKKAAKATPKTDEAEDED